MLQIQSIVCVDEKRNATSDKEGFYALCERINGHGMNRGAIDYIFNHTLPSGSLVIDSSSFEHTDAMQLSRYMGIGSLLFVVDDEIEKSLSVYRSTDMDASIKLAYVAYIEREEGENVKQWRREVKEQIIAKTIENDAFEIMTLGSDKLPKTFDEDLNDIYYLLNYPELRELPPMTAPSHMKRDSQYGFKTKKFSLSHFKRSE